MAAMKDNKLEPPALMNGKAVPAIGKIPTITPILITASIIIQNVKPAAITDPSISGALLAIRMPLQRITA